MAYIENPFKVNQYVLCINDDFPVMATTDNDKSIIGTHPLRHPSKGEICCVDELLGEYLRFDEYDDNDENSPDYGWKWWKHTRFKAVTKQEVENHYEQVGKNVKEWFDKIIL